MVSCHFDKTSDEKSLYYKIPLRASFLMTEILLKKDLTDFKTCEV